MKTMSVVVAFTLGSVAVVQAQGASAHNELGLFGGPSHSTLGGTDALGDRHWSNLLVGGRWTWRANRAVALEPEILVSERGAGRDLDQVTTNYRRITYLDLPLLARISGHAGQFRPYLLGGPIGSIRIDCRDGELLAGARQGHPCDAGALRRTDFGAMVGGGLALGRFDLGARYDYGLSNISTAPGADLKNRFFAVTVGMTLLR